MIQSILKTLLGIIVFIFIGITGLTLTQPDTYRVVRSIEIQSSPPVVFQNLSDLRNWKSWSPWAKRDADMVIKFSENTDSIGSFSTWVSKTEGNGKQTIVEAVPNRSLKIHLEFYEPFKGTAQSDFTLIETSPGQTKITWGLDGINSGFVEKFFYTLMDFDKMIGKDYEAGLSNLKNIIETK